MPRSSVWSPSPMRPTIPLWVWRWRLPFTHSPTDHEDMAVRGRGAGDVEAFLNPEVWRVRVDARHFLSHDIAADDFWCLRCSHRIPVGSSAFVLDDGSSVWGSRDDDVLFCSRRCAGLEIDRRKSQVTRDHRRMLSRRVGIREEQRQNREEIREYKIAHGPFSSVRIPVVGWVLRWAWSRHVYRQQSRLLAGQAGAGRGSRRVDPRRMTVGDLF